MPRNLAAIPGPIPLIDTGLSWIVIVGSLSIGRLLDLLDDLCVLVALDKLSDIGSIFLSIWSSSSKVATIQVSRECLEEDWYSTERLVKLRRAGLKCSSILARSVRQCWRNLSSPPTTARFEQASCFSNTRTCWRDNSLFFRVLMAGSATMTPR